MIYDQMNWGPKHQGMCYNRIDPGMKNCLCLIQKVGVQVPLHKLYCFSESSLNTSIKLKAQHIWHIFLLGGGFGWLGMDQYFIKHMACLDGILMKLRPGTGDDLFATSSKLPDRHAIRSGGRHGFFGNDSRGVLRDAKVLRWQNFLTGGRWHIYPIGSMYGIYANIGGILMVNVTICSIHGSYGYIYIYISIGDYWVVAPKRGWWVFTKTYCNNNVL